MDPNFVWFLEIPPAFFFFCLFVSFFISKAVPKFCKDLHNVFLASRSEPKSVATSLYTMLTIFICRQCASSRLRAGDAFQILLVKLYFSPCAIDSVSIIC